ncbi:MAG TPA: hypothetical protein DD719_01715 [Desulfotomaculum sp.]|jgi:uncharacterized protein YycO|nr:hypothetical protein [Desulfotomaculum sp.]
MTLRRTASITIIIILLSGFLFFSLKIAQKKEACYQAKGEYPPLIVRALAAAGRGELGSGKFGGKPNHLDLSLLQPGDILLGGNPGSSYGFFTHAGLYIGNNQVVDMYISTGVYLTEAKTYQRYYDRAAILRVKASPDQKKAAVDYALTQIGKPFFILAPKKEDGLWYCTKLIWRAYLAQGIDLDTLNSYWVLPDSFWLSPQVQVIYFTKR